LRLKRLLESVKRFNVDHLDFYISTPKLEKELLEQVLGWQGYIWVSDEDIVEANPSASYEKYQSMPGGISQAIIKSEFWRLKKAENYLCLDSDCVFIRPFSKADFMANDQLPFTIIHQNKEYFQLALDRGKSEVMFNLQAEAQRVRSLFERVGPEFYCAPAPFIWSSKVWESLDREFLKPRSISIWELITSEYPETLIYGEALLKYRAIPLVAIEPLFRVYHYNWQYFLMKRIGETEEKLKKNYLGVIYQSNWESSLAYDEIKKPFLSQFVKNIKNFLRYLQSYI
jgi:hypothetical protein